MKTLIGTTSKASTHTHTVPNLLTRDLNNFYARFGTLNCTTGCESLVRSLPTPEQPHFVTLTVGDVHQQLRRCNTVKAPGPDGITGRLLRNCAMELSPVLQSLFKETLQTATAPTLWKKAAINPVPKKSLQTSSTYLHNSKMP